MSCRTVRTALVDRARNAAESPAAAAQLDGHLAACPACRDALARETALTHDLRDLAGSAAGAGAMPELEARLLAAFERQRQIGSLPRWMAAPRRALAAAAAVVLVSAAAWTLRVAEDGDAPEPDGDRAAAAAPAGEPLDGFVALPAAAGLPPFESGVIVRIELPVASLPAYGVEMVPAAAAAQVEADVLVGQDGLPRAIRLVDGDSDF